MITKAGMAMKKKVVFMLIDMNVGGTEKALLHMVSDMPKEQFEITLLLLESRGGFLPTVPEHVQVKTVSGYPGIKDLIHKPLHYAAWGLLRKGRLMQAVRMLYLYVLSKTPQTKGAFYKSVLRHCPPLDGEYDVAVAYAGPMDFISYFVIHKIKAKQKLQWIHFDPTRIDYDRTLAAALYSRFHHIFVVSKEGKNKFLALHPELKAKTNVYIHRISLDSVKRMAEEGIGFEDEFDGMRILTVGRLSKEKGQDLTIPVLARLKREGYKVRWYCIGEGRAREEYEQLIREYRLEEDYILLGVHTNPYPFMKQCDVYVQPSRHEGYCITLAEAKCFHKPIVATAFTGAAEQIEHERTGLLVDFHEDELYAAVRRLMDDETLRNKLKSNMQKGSQYEKGADHVEQHEYRRRGEVPAFPAFHYSDSTI